MNTTKTTQFTPGPWVVHTFTISGKEKLEVLDATGTNACVQANAHLIAAAPAMYTLLQDATLQLARLTGSNLETYARTFSVLAKKALAQAEGVDHE